MHQMNRVIVSVTKQQYIDSKDQTTEPQEEVGYHSTRSIALLKAQITLKLGKIYVGKFQSA